MSKKSYFSFNILWSNYIGSMCYRVHAHSVRSILLATRSIIKLVAFKRYALLFSFCAWVNMHIEKLFNVIQKKKTLRVLYHEVASHWICAWQLWQLSIGLVPEMARSIIVLIFKHFITFMCFYLLVKVIYYSPFWWIRCTRILRRDLNKKIEEQNIDYIVHK
jgi:hypothetical protein